RRRLRRGRLRRPGPDAGRGRRAERPPVPGHRDPDRLLMTVTSGNPVDLATFVDGSNTATSSVSSSLQGVVTKANAVSGACSFSHPSTPSLAAAGELLTAWQ